MCINCVVICIDEVVQRWCTGICISTSSRRLARSHTHSLYNNIAAPSKLQHGMDMHLFKKGVEPKWEDKSCVHGGCWRVQLPPAKGAKQNLTDTAWLHAVRRHDCVACCCCCCVRCGVLLLLLCAVWCVAAVVCGVACYFRMQRVTDCVACLWSIAAHT